MRAATIPTSNTTELAHTTHNLEKILPIKNNNTELVRTAHKKKLDCSMHTSTHSNTTQLHNPQLKNAPIIHCAQMKGVGTLRQIR